MNHFWKWKNQKISWQVKEKEGIESPISIVLIHGFGASKDHWRFNQPSLSSLATCYAIDLIGFGESSQPKAQLLFEKIQPDGFKYCFDNWSQQIIDFCDEIVQKPVLLIGNSIGGVIALNASRKIKQRCSGVVLIDCAQRTMDDKRLSEQPILMRFLRPIIKTVVRQRFLSKTIFKNAANKAFIEKILKIAYPSGKNLNSDLIDLLFQPTQRDGASEAFRGFINLFDDHLAPDLMTGLNIPVYLIWGDKDPWEPIVEAQKWKSSFKCIKSLDIIKDAGHCPHDEKPEEVNSILMRIVQEAI